MSTPGFEIVPPTTSISQLPKVLSNPIPVIEENLKKYGDPYGVRMGDGKISIVSTNPSIVQHVLQKKHRNYSKSDIQTEKIATFIGKGLLTLDGQEWLRQRKLIQPGFHKKKIDSIKEKMEHAIVVFYENLLKDTSEHSPIDIHEKMMQLAFKIVSYSLFGDSVTPEQMQRLRHAIEVAQVVVTKLIRLPFLSWWYEWSGIKSRALKLVNESCKDLLSIIHQRRKEGEKGDLLDMLLEARYEDTGTCMSDQQLIFELMILFVAGHETTANSLSWTFYSLARHPDVLKKLRNEISSGNTAYTRQVINESMRLFPPAWFTDRLALVSDEIEGIHIPKNSLMINYIYGLHRNQSTWERADKFDPDRFEEGKHIIPYSFLPFGGGPRSCIGMQFAMMEMELAVYHFVSRFQFELVNQKEVSLKPLVTLRPKGPINMKVAPL
ncbi:MAG: cytochrome P450 [Bacteroidota bacterium]